MFDFPRTKRALPGWLAAFGLFCFLNAAPGQVAGRPVMRLDFTDQQLNADEITLAECLQGLANRAGPLVYYTTCDDNSPNPRISSIWLGYLTNELGLTVTNAAHFRDLIQRVRDAGAIAGLVRYDSTNLGGAETQLAITLAGQLQALPVTDQILNYQSPGLKGKGTNSCFSGLPVLADLRGRWNTKLAACQWLVTNRLSGSSSHEVFCDGGHWFGPVAGTGCCESGFCGRDYAVKLNAFCFDFPLSQPAYAPLFNQVMAHLQAPAAVLGVWPGYAGGETEGTTTPLISRAGNYWLLSHHAMNLSFLSGISVVNSNLYLRRSRTPRALDPSKYYILFQTSEGDTIKQIYDLPGTVGWRDPLHRTVPIGWGINPSLSARLPVCLQWLNTHAGPRDTFFAGPGGAGYVWLKFMSPTGQAALGAVSEPCLETTGLQLVDMWGLDTPSLLHYSARTPAARSFTGEFGPTNALLNGLPLSRCAHDLWYGGESMSNSLQVVGRIQALAAAHAPPYFIPVYDTVDAIRSFAEICATNLGPQFVIVGVEDYLNLQEQWWLTTQH